MDKDFMTIREVTKLGILPESELRKRAKEHRLPCLVIGKQKKSLINVAQLRRMLDEECAQNMAANGGANE